jgi:hypothetical protein
MAVQLALLASSQLSPAPVLRELAHHVPVVLLADLFSDELTLCYSLLIAQPQLY